MILMRYFSFFQYPARICCLSWFGIRSAVLAESLSIILSFPELFPEKFRYPRQKFVANGKLKIYVNFGAQLMVAARINTDYLFSHLEVPDREKKKKKMEMISKD